MAVITHKWGKKTDLVQPVKKPVDQGDRLTMDDIQVGAIQQKKRDGLFVEERVKDTQVNETPGVQKIVTLERKADPKKVELSNAVKERVNEGIQFLFANSESEDFAERSNSVAGDLMNSIMDSDAVAFDIDQLKINDEYTFKHSVDVAAMSLVIGKNMGLTRDELKELGVAGLLHDVGKSEIPNEILNKPARLTDEEFTIMKLHSEYGFKILQKKKSFKLPVMFGVRQHHEKINGRGYPNGLSGSSIGKYARIISVADIYDALVTERPYKKGFPKAQAVEMIMAMTGELDNDVIKSFLDTVILYPVDSYVKLSNGEICRVLANNPKYPLRPKVVSLRTEEIHDLSRDLDYACMTIPGDARMTPFVDQNDWNE